jgi:hypothetical protein
MRRGKYVYHSTKRLPSDRRTKKLPGSGDDHAKCYKCWNCGFICDKDRDSVDRYEGRSGGTNTLYGPAREEYLVDEGNEYCWDEHNSEIIVDMGSYYPTMAKGCPLCGSTNYR